MLDALQPDTNMLIWGFLMLKLKAPFKATLLCNSGKKKKRGGVEIEMVREKLWWCLHESGHGEQQITAYVSGREELRQAVVGTTCTSHLDLGLKLL